MRLHSRHGHTVQPRLPWLSSLPKGQRGCPIGPTSVRSWDDPGTTSADLGGTVRRLRRPAERLLERVRQPDQYGLAERGAHERQPDRQPADVSAGDGDDRVAGDGRGLWTATGHVVA